MKNRSFFFELIGVIGMIAGYGEWFMYRESFLLPTWTVAIFLATPFTFVIPNTMEKYLPSKITRILANIGGYWLIFFYYSFYLLLIYALLIIVGFIAGNMWQQWLVEYFVPTGFYIILLLILIGGINAYHLTLREVEITSDHPLSHDLTIAFVSDIHLGTILGKSFARKLTNKIQAVQPDLVLIGGDIIDGNLSFVIKDESYKELSRLKAPLGVFAVYGNHDYYGMDIGKERSLFTDKINFLKDQSIILENCICLTGFDDYINNPHEIAKVNNDFFQIAIDHEPFRIAQAAEAGYDLYLSGHTHAGQFYPNRLVTKRMYLLDYGYKKFKQMATIVSNGCGFWGAPIRLGPSPEIVVIRLRNSKGTVAQS